MEIIYAWLRSTAFLRPWHRCIRKHVVLAEFPSEKELSTLSPISVYHITSLALIAQQSLLQQSISDCSDVGRGWCQKASLEVSGVLSKTLLCLEDLSICIRLWIWPKKSSLRQGWSEKIDSESWRKTVQLSPVLLLTGIIVRDSSLHEQYFLKLYTDFNM